MLRAQSPAKRATFEQLSQGKKFIMVLKQREVGAGPGEGNGVDEALFCLAYRVIFFGGITPPGVERRSKAASCH